MLLHHRTQGNGPSLIILHGLFGSMDNWRSLAPKFARQFQVITVDLPNHGRSPHKKTFNYPSLARDLAGFVKQHGIGSAALLGHSMGGKVAMQYALDFSEQVAALVVVDIAPRAYPPEHLFIFEALNGLNLSAYGSRKEIDKALSHALPDPRVRQFLLMNLDKGKNGYRWRINLPDLQRNYRFIGGAIEGERPYLGPSLFIKGGGSNYIGKGDEIEIRKQFPEAKIISIPNAGHWVHADAPEVFTSTVLKFLS